MRLLFISQTTTSLGEGCYYAFPPLAKLMEMLSPLYDEVELCVPVSDEPVSRNTSKLDMGNLTVSRVPFYFRRWEVNALRHPVRLAHYLWPHIKKADTVLIAVPNYLSVVAWLVCMLQRKRFMIRMAGNWPEVTRNLFHKKDMYVLGNAVGWVHHVVTKVIVKTSSLTITNGRELVGIYGRGNSHVVPVISSTYRKRDIAATIAGGDSEEPRVLYVGRFDLYKGIFELLRAASDMWAEGLKFRLVLAGEGMAKVVPEAMANGLATVVTRVGSLPEIVQEDRTGLIIPPRDVPALRGALRRLILDKPLRQSMARAGLERSYEFTIESEREHVRAALVKYGFLNN